MLCCSLESPDRFLRYGCVFDARTPIQQLKRIHAMYEHNNHADELPRMKTTLEKLPYVMLAPLAVTTPKRLNGTVITYHFYEL